MKIAANNHRFQSDRRQLGGLLMLLGFCAIIQPAANIVSGLPNNADPSEIPFWGLVGGLCLFINGTIAVIAGYMVTVHDWSHKYLTQFLMITIQTAWIPYITDMTNVGKGARVSGEKTMFIPQAYDPTDADVRFVGSIGILAILAYGFAFVGSIAFMVWSLHSYNTGKPEERSGDYFKGRLGFYSLVLAFAGFLQFLLGVYCSVHFETGKLSAGPVRAAFLTVSYPIMSILVGLVQFLNGMWAIARKNGYHLGPNDFSFQISMAFQWLLVLALQILAQIGITDLAPAAPTVAAISLGLNLMPAFLDHKMRTLPAQFPASYYSVETKEMMVAVDVESEDVATSVVDMEAVVPVEEVQVEV